MGNISVYNSGASMCYVISEFDKISDILFGDNKLYRNTYKDFPVRIVKISDLV